MTYSVLIIGCGNIAGGLDEKQHNSSRLPLTHTKAFSQNLRFVVSGCVDPDEKRRLEYQRHWGVANSYETIQKAISDGSVYDVVSICSPTDFHLDHLEQALALSPKLVFCEKPIGGEILRAAAILEQYASKNIPILINYSRRFDESVERLKRDFEAGRYGNLLSVAGFYSKGVLNNGSHLLDLLLYLFGELSVDYVGMPVIDFDANDPTVPLVLRTSSDIQMSLLPGNAKDFSLAELTFVFAQAQVTMMDGGLNWSYRDVAESEFFSGYRVLQAPRIESGMYLYSLQNAVANIYDVLAGRRVPSCTGEDGLRVLKLCAEIMSKVST